MFVEHVGGVGVVSKTSCCLSDIGVISQMRKGERLYLR